ncbi:MAG: DUF3187 family protein [Gemmatimonadota bacterium]
MPAHEPLNPTSASRSGVYAQPYVVFSPEKWRASITLAYGNAIESDSVKPAAYLLDAEILRVEVGVLHDFSARTFGRVDAALTGAYGGFADGFFLAYHKLIHFRQRARQARPKNTFGYEFTLPDGTSVHPRPDDAALGDVRATFGVRHSEALQSVVSLTLPTATGPAGYGRGTVSLNMVQTALLPLAHRFTFEGTLGVGITPSHGALAAYQRTTFGSASAGLRFRFRGSQSIYGYLFYHTPYYHGTTLRSLDRRELTGDFGWIRQGRNGREWHIGLGEDLAPGDPGIDLILKAGTTW